MDSLWTAELLRGWDDDLQQVHGRSHVHREYIELPPGVRNLCYHREIRQRAPGSDNIRRFFLHRNKQPVKPRTGSPPGLPAGGGGADRGVRRARPPPTLASRLPGVRGRDNGKGRGQGFSQPRRQKEPRAKTSKLQAALGSCAHKRLLATMTTAELVSQRIGQASDAILSDFGRARAHHKMSRSTATMSADSPCRYPVG